MTVKNTFVRLLCTVFTVCILAGILPLSILALEDGNATRAGTPSSNLLDQINNDTEVAPWGYGAQNAINKFKNSIPLSIAHRGAWRDSSENSLVAIYDAIRLGVDAVEVDVMLSSDGVVVLSHDTTIDRCTTSTGTVSSLPWSTLKSATLVTGLGTGDETGYMLTSSQASILNSLPNYASHYGAAAVEGGTQSIARFDDALDLVKKYGPNTYVTPDKLSSDAIFAACYKLVREKGMLNNVMFKFSRSPETFNAWAQKAADTWNAAYPSNKITANDVKNNIIVMYVVGSPDVSALQKHLNNGSYIKAVEVSYTQENAASYEEQIRSTYAPFCRSNNMALYGVTIGPTWAGGRNDDEATWTHFLSLGFNGMATDRPDEMVAFLYQYNRTRTTSETIQAEHFSGYSSSHIYMNEAANINRNKVIKGLFNGDYLTYQRIKFTGSEKKIYFRARGLQSGTKLNFYINSVSSGNLIASCTVPVTDSCVNLEASLSKTVAAGTYAVYVQASGTANKEIAHFDCFSFQPDNHYLLFDFEPSTDNKERYKLAPYGGLDYTSIDAWHSNDPESIANGAMTIDITGSTKSYHYIRTGTGWNDIPLKYTASENAYCQIRFKLDNVAIADTSYSPEFAIYYFYDESNNPKASYYRFNIEDYNNKGYFTITLPLNRFSGEVKALRAFFNNVKPADSGKSTITYDYFYVGPIEPDESILFTFDQNDADRQRYQNIIYGNTDYTNISNWWYRGTRSTKPVISNGAMSFSILPNYAGTYHYVQSSPNNNMNEMPMKYTAGSYDFCQIRFKIDNAIISDSSYGTSLHLYFAPDAGDTGNRRQISVTFDLAKVNNNGYHILTFPMDTAPYLDARKIKALRPMFNNMISASGKTATFTMDYIYVGPEEGLPTKHTYENKVTSPTCTAQGYTTHTCKTCAYSYKDNYTNATGHSYSYKATKNPTTSAAGTLTGTCSKCSGATTVTLPKLNTTDYSYAVTKAATCAATGTGRYTWKTTTYGSFYFDVTIAKTTNHSYNSGVITTQPTCTAVGVKTFTCSVCKGTKTESVAAKGHTEVIDKAVAATCTTAGKTEGKHCSVCNAVLVAQQTVPAKGHTEVIDKAVAATCTTAGKTEGKHCSVCNAVLVAQQTMPAKGHTEVIDKAVAATCTTAGKTEGKHCSVCNAVLVAQQTMPAKGHTEVIDKAVEATCTETGLTEGKHCSTCNTILVAQQTIPAKGHTEVIDKAVEATCTETGLTEGKHCSVCSEVLTAQQTIPAKGHTEVIDKAVEVTCTENGLTEGKHCSVCNAVLVAQQTVPAKGHTEVIDKAVEATCTENGLTEGKHCSVCDTVLVAQQTVPPRGHSYVYSNVNVQGHLVTCENCDLSVETSHSFTDGSCICGEAEIKEAVEDVNLKLNHSLNLASDISVNLLIPKALLEGFDMTTVYVESIVEIYEGNEKAGTTTIQIDPVDNGNYYYFTLDGLTAVQMNDKISSVLYGTKDGQPYYSPADEYSIASYAYSQLNNPDRGESLKILCADLLRYGAKAQIFKAYRTNALADANMTDVHKAYLSDIEAVTFGNTNKVLNDVENAPITWSGKSLNLESKVALKFIFDPANYIGDLSKLTLQVRYEDVNGNSKLLILRNPELYNTEGRLYAFTLDALLAADLRAVVSVQIFAGEMPVSCTLRYSADTYGNNKTGTLLDLCKALFAYSDSAKTYFAS